jgi:uroporphyrin-III C-methyltransferase/precorrin-2 dehydrogenase/sirohydrochlorin ferrochelatase
MDSIPIFMKIKGLRCVVVGGGDVAMRKVSLLLKADASVEVFAPTLCDALNAKVISSEIQYFQTIFKPCQLTGSALVIVATNDKAVNACSITCCERKKYPSKCCRCASPLYFHNAFDCRSIADCYCNFK